MVKLRVILMIISMFVAIYALFHFTGIETEMNYIINGFMARPSKTVETPTKINTKINSYTKAHFSLLFYPSKPKNEVIYIEEGWKKTAEFELICEIEKDFPPNWTKDQVKNDIISVAKKRKSNVVIINYLSTEYKVE